MSPRGHEQNEAMREQAVKKITEAALRVFAEYGYHGATMKQIAMATGLSYGLVYHYFPSKEKIFLRLVDFALGSTIAAMQAVFSGPGTAWARIQRYTDILVQSAFSGESVLYFLIMMQAMTQGRSIPGRLLEHIEKRTEAYYKMLVPCIIEAQKTKEAAKGDPVVLAAVYFSLIQGLALLVFQGKGLEKKILPENLLSVLRKG